MPADNKDSLSTIRSFITQQCAALGVMLGQLDDPYKGEFKKLKDQFDSVLRGLPPTDQAPAALHAIDNAGGTEKLLTKAQVAQLCQVTERTIDAWMQSGYLVYYKLGRTVRFRLADLQTHWDATCRVARRTR